MIKAVISIFCVILLAWSVPALGAPFHPDHANQRLSGIPDEPLVPHGPAGGVFGTATRFGRTWTGHPRILVILVDFSDLEKTADTYDHAYYRKLLFSEGELESGSLREYYQEASYGQIDVTGEMRGWYRLPQTYEFYVNGQSGLCAECYPRNGRGLAADALAIAVNDGLDISQFDNDGPDGIPGSGDDDGIIDGLIIVFPGFGSERTGTSTVIRSHYWSFNSATTVDGIEVPDYLIIPERENVGVAIHEFGHLLGAIDLYDLSGLANGLGYYSVMAIGMWLSNGQRPGGPDAYTRILWGLIDPENPGANEPEVEIPAVRDTPYALRLWTNGELDLEYFLVENRRAEGFDRFLPVDGLLVYHVDERVHFQNNPGRYRVALVQADGQKNLEGQNGRNAADFGDCFPCREDVREWDDHTNPSAISNLGDPTEVALRNISDPGPVMTVSAEVGNFIAPFPIPRMEILPVSGIRHGGLVPGTEGMVLIRINNHGTRLNAGSLTLFSRDPRVLLDEPVVWNTQDLAALDHVIFDPLRITVTGVPEDSRAILPLEAVWETRSASHRMAAPLPLLGTRIRDEGFEEPSQDILTWSTVGDRNPWTLQQRITFDGEWAWGTNPGAGYDANQSAVLQVGPVELGHASELRFFHYVHTQAFDGYSYDGGFLEASSDFGDTWELVTPVGGYPTTFALTQGNPHSGVPAWGGPVRQWEEVVVPLTHLSGKVLFRFHFSSDFTGSIGIYDGWFIDDLVFRSWSQTYTGVFDDPVIGDAGVEIGFSVLSPFDDAVSGRVRLTRESGQDRDTFGPWAFEGSHDEVLLIADQEPGRVYRYWLDWEDPEQPRVGPLTITVPGSPPRSLFSGTPGVVSKSGGGQVQYLVPGVDDSHVTLEMFDIRGGRVARLVDLPRIPGPYTTRLPTRSDSGRTLAAGVYFLQLRGDGFHENQKLTLIP